LWKPVFVFCLPWQKLTIEFPILISKHYASYTDSSLMIDQSMNSPCKLLYISLSVTSKILVIHWDNSLTVKLITF